MLSRKTNGKQIIYFDSAASSHKPAAVIKKLSDYYTKSYGKPDEEHAFSKVTTEALDTVRSKVGRFIGAPSPRHIIFTRGCTESVNIVAHGFGASILKEDDEIIITAMEHHSNLVPWQMAAESSGAILKVAPITETGELDLTALEMLLTKRTRIVAISHSSHVLGTILPVRQIADMVHAFGAALMVDGAQAAPHMPVNMRELDCDFYSISAHKMGGPTGVGVLYGKSEWLNKIVPLVGGGDMVKKVSFDESTYAELPKKFEGGTMPFAEIIAFGTLIDYLQKVNMKISSEYEIELLKYATGELTKIKNLVIYGTAAEKEPLISFTIKGRDVKKLEAYLNDSWSIAVRAGDLTAQPLMKVLGVKQLLRVSFSFYNTYEEIDVLVKAIQAFTDRKTK